MLRVGMLALFSALFLGCGLTNPSVAQKPADEKTFGDWAVYEDMDYDGPAPKKAKGVPDTAKTVALDNRKAMLGFHCLAYSAPFFIEFDDAFDKALPRHPESVSYHIVYLRTDKSESLFEYLMNKSWKNYIAPQPETLIPAKTLMICPTNDDKNPACLSFSLKGITAALKAVCPKR